MARRLAVPLLAVALTVSAVVTRIGPAASAESPSYAVRGSVEQVAVTGAPAGATVRLLDAGGKAVGHKLVDQQGAALFRQVKPGSGYRAAVSGERSAPVTVTSAN